MVRTPVRHQSSAVVVPCAESEPAWLERLLRRRPLPHIPIEARRHRLLGLLRPRVRPGLDDIDVGDVAEDAAVEDLLRFHEVIPAALLGPDLDDLLALTVGVEHGVQPRHRVRRRFLDVDVLAGGNRIDGLLAVPVIRRADQYRVDVLAFEDAPVVPNHIELERLPRRRHERIELRLVHFGASHPLHVRLPRERVEHPARAVAAADHRQTDPVVGALHAEDRPRRRNRQGGGRSLQELAPAFHRCISLSVWRFSCLRHRLTADKPPSPSAIGEVRHQI